MFIGILYILYWISLISSGYLLYGFMTKDKIESIFSHASSILLGVTVGVSLTYLLTVLLSSFIAEPIIGGSLLYSSGVFLLFYFRRRILKTILLPQLSVADVMFIFFSFLTSAYMMIKTFKYLDGTFLLERNVIFDFAHLLSIVRSMSLGSNIPYQSPFVSGTDHIYHFLFAYLSALGEKLSVPISWAINIPSIIGFWIFLLLIYGFIISIQKLPKFVGIIGVLFICFQSSFTFFHWLTQQQITFDSFWGFPNYFFAGPFDNSIISLFVTLNTFVNQRHVSFALGYVLLFLSYIYLKKNHTSTTILMVGIVTGLLVPWHITIVPFILTIGVLQFFWAKKFSFGLLLIVGSMIGFLPYSVMWFTTFQRIVFSIPAVLTSTLPPSTHLPIMAVDFFLQNFGLLVVFVIIGLIWGKKYRSMLMIPLVVCLVIMLWQFRSGIVDQKVFSVFLVLLKLIAVIGVYKLSLMKWGKVIVSFFVVITLLSGILDFLVIKNDFVYAVSDWPNNKLIRWIMEETPKDTIILSYQEMFDPVVLAGRKQYYAFFKQPKQMWPDNINDRDQEVGSIYAATDVSEYVQSPLHYIILPKIARTDFYYDVSYLLNTATYPTVYEDEEVRVISVEKRL